MYTVLNKYRKQIDKKKNEDDKAGSIFFIFFIFLFSRLTRNNNTHKNFKKEKITTKEMDCSCLNKRHLP